MKEAASSRPPLPSSRTAFGVLGGAGAALLLFLSFRGVDVGHIAELIQRIGAPALFLSVPFLLSMGLESIGFQRVLGILGEAPRASRLLKVRVAADAVGSVLPMGALLVEAIKPKLLERHAGVPLGTGVAGIAARKYLLVLSQAAYLAVGFFAGRAGLSAAFDRLLGRPELADLVLAAAVMLGAVAFGVGLLLRGGTAFERALTALARVPSDGLRAVLGRWRGEIARTDETLSRFFHPSESSRRGKILCFYLGAWLLEATETWVILHALGSTVAWGDAVGIEALVMLARNVLVMLPGGLGVQELGYATLLVGVAGDLGVCAALALLKRARELLWALVGFALLAWDRASVRQWGGDRGVRALPTLPTLPTTAAFQVGE